MTAVKAKYNNGKVEWETPPPVTGSYNLTVYFDPEGPTLEDKRRASERSWSLFNNIQPDISLINELMAEKPVETSPEEKDRIIAAMHKRAGEIIPPGVSLADELIAERRLEAARE